MLQYKGLKGTLERLIVSEDRVEARIGQLMEQNPRILQITDRPSRLDDEVVLDYAGYCDGVAFEGGTAERQTLVLGSGAFIPGFEDQLVGKNVGDDVDVAVTFPTQYHAPALAGKAAVFKCKIHEIRQRQKYTDGDAFAREICGLDSMDALRTRLREGLQAYADQQAEEDLKLRLLDQVAAVCGDDFSPEALDNAIQQQLNALEAQLNRQGLTLDAYCQFTGKTVDQLRADCAPDARQGLKRQRALNEIIRAEGIEADEESVAEAIRELCRQNNMTVEQLTPHIDERAQTAIVQNVLNAKALDCLRANAAVDVVEKQE